MSILKLSKNDIYKNGEDDKKIKLSRSQISYDSAMVSDWETRNKEAYDALEKYRQRINSGGYLSTDDLSSYRTALDSYVETSTGLRGISKAFGQGEMDDDQKWSDTISQMETGYKGLSDYFSQWKTEADFKVAMEQAKANEQRMVELTNGYDPAKHQQDGKAGWEAYVAYQEQKAQKAESTPQEKQWWETLLGYLGDVGSDTSLPGVGGSQVLDMSEEAQRKEANKLNPDERWNDEQKEIFGYLWNTERQKASQYAIAVNNMLDKQAEDAKIKEIQESATGNFFAGVGHTLGAIASAPLGLADYLGDLIYQGAVGYIPQADGEITPFEYSQAVTGGVSQHLNDVGGTLNENIPVIGGKGWGDVYGLGTSIAQSSLAAFAGGSGQALVTFFGSAAASGVDDALSRGASGAQAIAYGTLSGLAEGLAENIGVDNLLKIGASKTMREFTMNILKQGAAEGLEEGITTLMNNFADQLVLQDKSNFATLVHRHMLMGLSESDAKKQAWMDMANDLAFDMVGGFVSGAVHAGPQTAYQTYLTGKEMKTTHGGSQQELVGEALEINPDNAFAQKMQGRLDKGKNLSGMQVRNILASNQEQITTNDMKKIQKAAEARLTALGQTADVSKVAELATKWATGQELTRAEKRLLTTSQYGSRVANELLPSNIDSGKYSTEWAEEIGTRSVNAKSYNKKAIRTILDAMASAEDPATYKSLEDRVGGESSFGVSKSGQATIRETGEAISIDNVEVVGIDKGDMSLQVDGKEVKASDIDFADESQSYLFDAVSKIEHITPGAATAIIRDYNPTTGQTMGEYLNGIDEGYTYGYYGYSEADLKAGSFAPKLTSEQMMSAYKLGQSARKISDTIKTEAIKRMRTAVEAEVEKATANDVVVSKKEKTTQQNSKNLTVTYNKGGGKVVDIDKAGIKDAKRSGAVEVAKILHKMGLGTKVEFFSSYLSTDANGNEIRVFLDDNGVEQRAYSGVYRKSDGTIRIDLEAYNGRGLTLNALSHELTHFIQQWSAEKYQVLADFLIKSYEKTDMTMHERVLKEQARLEKIRGKEVSYDEAFDEVVSNAMSKMFDDGKLVEKLTELRAEDESLARKLWEGFKKILSKFIGIYEKESALFKDAADLVAMKETFEQLQNMFAEALVEASENHQASQQIGLEIDMQTESVSPAVMNSEHTWTESDYVQERDKAAKEIAKAIGVSEKKAKDYIDSINSIAKMIAEDRSRLDYFSSPGKSSFVDNAEYGGSFDFSTLCKKRRLLTGTFTAIQKALPNTALTADEILDIRNRMKEANLEVSCGLCYVEGSRANMGQFAKEFLRLYKQYYPDAWQPNMADVNTPEGIEWVRINHPECYEQYEYFWNHYGTLKDGDKNLFASQQKPKLYQLHTEYKSEILQKFKGDDKVEDKNLNGGIRLQSFSDFEIVHLIDAMQIIMDMSRVGLAGQAYTKVPDFAWALGDTGLKINLSLIAKGVDADGKLIFDDVEGMPIADAMKLRDRYSKNVGTILVAFNDEQLLAAMADDRVDFIIPFHRSQWKKSQYEAMGLPAKTKDYTFMQNEKYIKPQFHEYRGRMVKDKASNYMPNEYWDFSKSGKENTVAYLEMCARNNKRPKFYKLLQNNGDGSYSLKADGSTDGYWKLLIDFKMYDNEGVGSPQMAVKPEFNMEEANRMLNDYKGGHSTFPVAKGIVDSFVKDYKASHKGEQYSSQETDLDSDGRQLSKEQAEYFKDSKVRNENGRLKVMYHGTANGGFNTFDTYGGKYGLFGAGSYFTDSKDVAKKYTDKFNERGNDRKQVYETYLNITNPIDMDALANPDEWAKAFPEASFPESGTNEDFFRAMEEYFYDEMYFKWEAAEIAMESIEGMGYDGITHIGGGRVNPDGERHRVYIAFKPEQIKNVDNTTPTSDSDIRYSSHETDVDSKAHPYSYNTLVSKPDMVVTEVDVNIPNNRADLVHQAKQNAAKVGRFDPKTGSVSVYVNDVGADVVIGTQGLKHGLEARREENSIVTLKAGEILKNSIRINELTPKRYDANGSYVLVGVAADNNGSFYIVRSVVNQFSYNLISMDVLYAINAKKGNRLRSMRPGFQGPVTDSTISVAELLDLVNRYFPDVLPEDVLKHYGYDARPDGVLGKDALYSSHETDADYMDAVNRGDTKTAQMMVDEAAKKAGYTIKAYHGTDADTFNVFDKGKIGVATGVSILGDGFYFSENRSVAQQYGQNVYEVYLKQTSPYTATNDDSYRLNAAKLETDGYDSVAMATGKGKIYMVLDPEQIKSADPITYDDAGNVIPLSQRFNTANDDIRYSSHETDLDSDSRSYAEITEEQQKLYQREMQIKERKRIVENDPELLQAMDEVSDMFTEMRDLLPKRRNGTATQEELDRIEELKALRDERIQRVAKLQESLGLNAISQEESDLREKKEALRVAADAAWAREGADKENKAIEKAGVSAAEYFRKKALKAFKTTTNFNEAGYLLPDGTLLNFSGGERNHRYRDHREIGEIYEATQGTAALNRFLNDGNIRIMAESPGIDLASGVEPTKEQYAELRRFINTNGVKDGQFFVDFSGAKGENAGKYAYNGKIIADRIINDIKYFYQTGNVRESSGLTDFLYSEHETDSSNRSLLANAFEGITQNSNEYKLIQEYKGRIKLLNEYEAKLSDLNAEIRKILFESTGARDTARLEQLQAEAKRVAENINRNDKKLLSLEASEPLRKVIERERKKEATKTKDHVKEIQQNKKVRAEQTELRHKIRKAIRDLDKILNRGNKKLNVKEELQPVVTKALQAAEILFTDNYGNYDMLRNGLGVDLSDAEEALVNTFTKMLKDIDKMPTDSYEGWQARQEAENRLNIKMSKLKDVFARERKRLNNTTVSSILGELADAYATLNDSTLSYVQGAYSEPVYNFLKNLQSEVGGTIVKDMTKNQLEHIYAAYRMVLETVRNANKMFNEELKQSREQLGNAVIQEVREAGGVHLLGTKTGDAVSQFNWNNLKPIWVGDRIGSETFGRLMHGLFKGQYNFAKDIDEVRRFKLEMDSKYKPRDWDAEKLYAFESSTGKEFSLNLQQIMSLYAFSKREQAYSHLISGGFVFEENSTVIVEKNGIKKTYIHKGATSYKLNVATLNRIVNSLTAEQMAYVDEMQAYLSDVMGAKGNEVSMKLYGIEMFKEKFYFPLRSSGAYMEKAKEAEMKKEQGQINLVNSGFTHSVKPEAKNPIVLSGFMDVWAEHSNEMSMYHSMVLPMEDFRKVYNYTTIHDENYDSASVYQTIQDAYGKAATNYIDQLYRELNAGATVDPRETPYKKLISNFKKSAVMLSASVVVQQFSSVGRAWAVIDPKYFTGTKVNSDTKLSAVEEMKKYAPVAIIKEMGGFDTGTKGNAKAYIMAEQYGKGERLKGFVKDEQYRGDIMGILPAKADEKTWIAIWEAAKRETKANNPKIDVKSEEFLKLAGERFSECIEKTQVYDSVLARSANMRSKGGLMQMATAFMAEPTTTVNLLENAIRKGDAKHIARAFGSVAVSIVLNNALASIVYAMRDDDEDETLMEKYFQSLTSGLIDDINPMSYYPFLKDVYSLFQGYDVERTDMSVIADVRDALKKAVSLLGKDTSDMDDEELAAHYKQVNKVFMGILDAGCSAFGVPVKNIRRDASGLINAFVTAQKDLTERDNSWLSFWDKVGSAVKDTIPVLAWTKDKAKTDKLYDAIVSGDKAYLDRLKSTYKTDSAYQSAVRNALRENDSRIHDAAQARYDGNTEDYKRIFKEIQNEGRFSFDDIMSAINSEESAIRKATKTTN